MKTLVVGTEDDRRGRKKKEDTSCTYNTQLNGDRQHFEMQRRSKIPYLTIYGTDSDLKETKRAKVTTLDDTILEDILDDFQSYGYETR